MPTRVHRPAPSLLTAGAAVVVALGLSACGTATIKTGEVESTIARQFEAQGVKLHDVTCRGDVKAEVGAPLSCTGLNAFETKLILEGEVTAIKDDKGSFQVEAVRGIAKGPVIETQALAIVKRQVPDARGLECPAEVRIPTAAPVSCGLTRTGGKVHDTRITIDKNSRLSAQVAKQPR